MFKPRSLLIWTLGIAFTVVGAVDVATAVLPVRLGDTNWEVAAFGELAASLAVPALGAVLVGFSAIRRRLPGLVLGVAVWLTLLGTVAGFGLVILGLDVPLVKEFTRAGATMESQLRILIGKSVILLGLYCPALWVLAGGFVLAFGKLRSAS